MGRVGSSDKAERSWIHLVSSGVYQLIPSVFVHRLRDADAAIRTDCLKELGVWIETYPSTYGDEEYLGYFTRGCNDPVCLLS